MFELLKNYVDEQDIINLYEKNSFDDLFSQPLSDDYVEKLREIIKKQKHLIERLCDTIEKLKKNISTCDIATQTKSVLNESTQSLVEEMVNKTDNTWKTEHTSVEEMVKEAAEDAMKQTGFVYESTSGLYYDYNTGYYYNAEHGLYYDGNSGTYYSYDKARNVFEFHSQVQFADLANPSEHIDSSKSESKRKKNGKSKTRKKIKQDHQSDVEEGECSDDSNERFDIHSDHETEQDKNKAIDSIAALKYTPDEMTKAWPPCMRIIVKETKVKNLKVGSLFLVTYNGGTLGREGDHLVLIPDLNISKYHAKFTFDTKDEKNEIGNYTLTDLGSRNGTFVDGKRLSTALQESDPHPISHDSTIRVGGTTLLCHVHSGRETCPDCEPGLLMSTEDDKRSAYVLEENMSEKRKNELKKLKKKFGFKLGGENNAPVTNNEYKDRAEIRRQTVGSHSDSFKTEVACVTQPIKKTNKGFKMLAKMGWSEGEALGAKADEAITEPILVQQRADKVGLGYDRPVEAEMSKADKKKQEMWKKAQMRYQNLEFNETT